MFVSFTPYRSCQSYSCSGELCFFFCPPSTRNQCEDFLLQSLAIADVVPQRRTQRCHAGAHAVMGGPATPHPPETLHHLELRTIPRQPIPEQMGMGRSHLLHAHPTMPGSIINCFAVLYKHSLPYVRHQRQKGTPQPKAEACGLRSIAHHGSRVNPGGSIDHVLAVAALLACPEAGRIDASTLPWIPPSTSYQL
jgi:hypothetical protein